MTETSLKLSVELVAEPSALRGTPLRSVEGLRAGMKVSAIEVKVTLCFETETVTEGRWLFGRMLDKLCATMSFKTYALRRRRSVDRALYEAISLDLLSRDPEANIHGREADSLRTCAQLEAGYRAWVDEDPTQRTSLKIAEDVLEYAADRGGVEAYVLDSDQLQREDLNLLLAVGGASKISPPRLVVATYGDPSPDTAPLMLVGKGITFDTGGINVKPYESFVSMMKNDMGGAALAWHLFKGLVDSDYPQPLVVVLPTCENPLGEEAMRPGSVVQSHSGLSVRIDHTDAEGRLILADALSWATQKYSPKEVISFATLTTAALVAYGPFATPVHFAKADLKRSLERASLSTGEDLHFFPARVWHSEANRDHSADLKNTGRLNGHASRGAGSRNAAHFLKFFTDAHLTHLDIFASTWDWSGQAVGTRHGATGSPLRTLLKGLQDYGAR